MRIFQTLLSVVHSQFIFNPSILSPCFFFNWFCGAPAFPPGDNALVRAGHDPQMREFHSSVFAHGVFTVFENPLSELPGSTDLLCFFFFSLHFPATPSYHHTLCSQWPELRSGGADAVRSPFSYVSYLKARTKSLCIRINNTLPMSLHNSVMPSAAGREK